MRSPSKRNLKVLLTDRREQNCGAHADTEELHNERANDGVRVRNFDEAVVSLIVSAAEIFGIPKSVAAIYAICFASAEPLSFADISVRLRISQGSLSQGLRLLQEMGALKIVETRERRDYFVPELELRRFATRFIEQRLECRLKSLGVQLREVKDLAPHSSSSSAKELKERIEYLQSWGDKGQALIPLFKALIKAV